MTSQPVDKWLSLGRRSTRIEQLLKRLTVDVDEGRSIIRCRLGTELGLDVELESPLVQ